MLHPRLTRSGVSLMEVLIAIFVTAFGLLGIAAIIPVGRITVTETAKADRCGAAGRAALREIRARRMLDPLASLNGEPRGWINPQGMTLSDLPAASILSGFCIDPLLITTLGFPRSGGDQSRAENIVKFPSRSVLQSSVGQSYLPLGLWRMSLLCTTGRNATGTAFYPLPDLAKRIFTWQDEWVFDDPGMQVRPRQMFTFSTGQTRELPFREEVGVTVVPRPTGFPLLRETQGNFSWMVTVIPNPADVAAAAAAEQAAGGASPLTADLRRFTGPRSFNVSVVVYYRRVLNEPTAQDELATERALRVQQAILGKGMGGGRLTLSLDTALSADQMEKWLNVNSGDWLLLCGAYAVTPGGGGAPVTYPLQAWYRVISSNTTMATENSRVVTVAGPDWEVPIDQTQAMMAVVPTNVVGVYTTVMDLDLSTLMAR